MQPGGCTAPLRGRGLFSPSCWPSRPLAHVSTSSSWFCPWALISGQGGGAASVILSHPMNDKSSLGSVRNTETPSMSWNQRPNSLSIVGVEQGRPGEVENEIHIFALSPLLSRGESAAGGGGGTGFCGASFWGCEGGHSQLSTPVGGSFSLARFSEAALRSAGWACVCSIIITLCACRFFILTCVRFFMFYMQS